MGLSWVLSWSTVWEMDKDEIISGLFAGISGIILLSILSISPILENTSSIIDEYFPHTEVLFSICDFIFSILLLADFTFSSLIGFSLLATA